MSRWIRAHAADGTLLYSIGINDDDTLWNPNNYPEDVVRTAVLAADARRHDRRSQVAKKAAKTRNKRQQHRVWLTAKRIAEKQKTGPRRHCFVCGRRLDDPISIKRGVGSECWQEVLANITAITAVAST